MSRRVPECENADLVEADPMANREASLAAPPRGRGESEAQSEDDMPELLHDSSDSESDLDARTSSSLPPTADYTAHRPRTPDGSVAPHGTMTSGTPHPNMMQYRRAVLLTMSPLACFALRSRLALLCALTLPARMDRAEGRMRRWIVPRRRTPPTGTGDWRRKGGNAWRIPAPGERGYATCPCVVEPPEDQEEERRSYAGRKERRRAHCVRRVAIRDTPL